MAITPSNVADATPVSGGITNSPDKYTTVEELLAYNKPDVRDELIKAYGDQGITGFLKMTGAVRSGGTADFITWFEEGRRHTTFEFGATAATTGNSNGIGSDGGFDANHLDGIVNIEMVLSKVNGTAVGSISAGLGGAVTQAAQVLNVGDVLLDQATGHVYIVNKLDTSADGSSANLDVLVARMDGTDGTASMVATNQQFALIGSAHPEGQAAGARSAFQKANINKLNNSYMIVKDMYQVTGSAATNIGYVNIGNGDYRWYIKGEQETRARFMDKREMMMLFSEKANQNDQGGTTISSLPGDIPGSEGYFAAVRSRGITATGDSTTRIFDELASIDNILIELDKEGAPAEYAMYLDRRTSLDIDDMLANGVATQSTAGLPGQFGAFNNDADLAVKLGFKSFTRGGYTFHKHDWKLMNDPQLLGGMTAAEYRGAMIPMASYVDPNSGVSAPALEMVYKEANGYSRELEHWVTGGAVIGNKTDDSDIAKFHYRSECQLVTRAANQHVILRGA
tara:strand:- start:20478 stop:22007 length:1530 start_codon:yes stop_codon:yes gene_type:complete